VINVKKIIPKHRLTWIPLTILGIILLYFLGNFIYAKIFKVVPDSTYYILPSISFNSNDKRMLVFSPHPDDETLSSGGLIQAAVARGIEVRVILVTDGNRRGQGIKRQAEFKKALEGLGVKDQDIIMLGYKDEGTKNVPTAIFQASLEKQINGFNPQIVVYPSRFDEHPDHRTTGLMVEKILQGNNKIEKWAYLVHYRGYPYPQKLAENRFLMPPSKLFFSCQWYKFNLTSDQEQKKLSALDNYQVSLGYRLEKGYLLGFVRQNELFCQE
jgi:LmbE family N-acetylglucosaminyl deacetylase